ncbi:hypothetical protein L7F22_046657 [Adiantum nelumboides]|nr:hypothetical protein [Adiantum nelumboides]MCO5592654.1 hypothetical protein [Adiantum nelumboides]
MWSSHLSRKLEIDRFTYSMASRSFLLVNLVIFLILVSLHLQQHATSLSRNGKTKKKGRRNSEHAERSEIIDDSKSSALPVMPSFEFARTENEQKLDGAATAAAARPGHVEATMDNNSGSDCVPADVADHHHVSTALQGHPLSLTEELSSSCDVSGLQDVAAASMESFSAQDSNAIPAADMEADASELPCRTVDEDCRPAVTADKIVLEEDGRLRLMEVPKRPRRRLRDAPFRNPQESSETHAHSKSSRSGLNPHHDSLSDLAIKEPRASHSHINVPKSISLSGNHPLIDCDPPNLTSSRSRVKSMDAMNDNTTRRLKTRKKAKGDSNMVKSAFTRLRREPSINSQDELNARVESFIATFNEKMRIQRQQSLLSFMQMVDRGG